MKKNLRLMLVMCLMSISWMTFAQQHTVNGSVKDTQGETLPGVSVVVQGTTKGTITDIDGQFQIVLEPNETTLVFSFVGFEDQVVDVAGISNVAIALKSSIEGLDEVVIVGYGSVKKSDLTGSVASVKAEDISSVPVGSVDQALQGRASGVHVVQNSGQPGAPTTIRIRGTNSIVGNNNPLIIVDGFPITGGLETINANDVENLEILKDASSTAIYGARATNGVIIVTTKKGKEGVLKIDLDSYYGIQDQSKKLDMMNAQQFMELANKRALNDGDEPYFPNPSAIKADTDWIDELFDPAPVQSHTLSFSGGTDKVKFSQTFNYFDQQGILKNSHYIKGSMRNNLEVKMNDWLTISNSAMLMRENRQYSGDGGNRAVSEAHLAPPTSSIYDEEGNYTDVSANGISPGALDNPMMWINEYSDQEYTTSIFDNFSATFKLMPGLTFKSSIGVDYSTSRKSFYKTRLLRDGGDGGVGGKNSSEQYSILNENILNYKKNIGAGKLDAIVGYNWQKYRWEYLSGTSGDFVTDDLGSNVLGAGSTPLPPYSDELEWGIQSFLGRVNYSLKDRYLFSATVRSDGSSRFVEGNKWATFPSVAMGWRLSEESFMDVDWLSNLKLRASWGKTGNQAVRPYETWSKMVNVDVVLGDELQVGYKPENMPNPNLKWETTTQVDLGLDLGIFDERFRFGLDYYSKKTVDLLALIDLPYTSGYSSSIQNIGEIQNRGFEFSVDAGVLESEFKWDASLQISTNKNKVLKLSKGSDVFAPQISNTISSFHILREGEPISMFYGYVKDGYDENGYTKYLDFAGTVVSVDENGNTIEEGDGEITEADRRIIGSPHPDFTFGLNNTFSYKGFTLNVFIDGSQGGEILNASKVNLQNSFAGGGNQLANVYHDHWTPTNTNAANPVISKNNAFNPSDEFIEDGSYVKIRSINLSYDIPTTKIAWLNRAQVYVNAQNMFTFTKYSGYDPEVSSLGNIGDGLQLGTDYYAYPSVKTITMGVKLSF